MIPYILHAGLILAGCLVFYKLLLRKETFYKLNRFVLLACLMLSFTLPFLRIPQQWALQKIERPVLSTSSDFSFSSVIAEMEEQTAGSIKPPQTATAQTSKVSMVINWVVWIYWFGVVVFGINFLIQLITLYYRAYTRPVIKDGKFRIVELSGDKAPCSFGNNIFINPEKYDWETYNQVLAHEKIHIEQGHTLDIVLAEIILIFQWFNPFAWIYRKELENNLEFLTDEQLLHDPNVEKTSYQMSLLKVSAPHFPLSLTTNYNQSLLKKRVVMMNAKRSNVNSTWRYFFILPLLVLFVCLLNDPIVVAQSPASSKNENSKNKNTDNPSKNNSRLETEGVWFATIKNEKITIQFKNEDDEHSFNSSSFELSEFGELPKERSENFQVTREAGVIQFTGRFEGNSGMGSYKFTPDKSFAEYLKKEGVNDTDEEDMMAFFIVNVKRSYVEILKQHGYTGLGKNDLLPLAALKVDADFIQSLKRNGFTGLGVHELISLKALNIDEDYIQDIRKAGFTNITSNQLVTFKAQGIDGKYITEMRDAAKKEGKPDPIEQGNPDDLVSIKALNIDPAYIRSLKDVGYGNLDNSDLVAMKAQGITAEYIKNLKEMGFKDLSASDIISIKAQNITAEFIKSFSTVGYKDVSVEDAIPLKALGVTPEYIRSFQEIGYKDIPLQQFLSIKAQGVTPALIQEYKNLGYMNISLEEVSAAKATGTTPAFINSMKEKGHNLSSIHKYIQLKTAID
jgi:hypothetical protein